MLNLQVSFVANTDNANLLDDIYADKNIKFTKLITSAGGLNHTVIICIFELWSRNKCRCSRYKQHSINKCKTLGY